MFQSGLQKIKLRVLGEQLATKVEVYIHLNKSVYTPKIQVYKLNN